MKQNSDNIGVSFVRLIKLPWITAHKRESHMPNLL